MFHFAPCRLAGSGDTFYWSQDEFENCDELEAVFESVGPLSAEEIQAARNGVQPPQITKVLQDRKLHIPSLYRTLKDCVYHILQHYYARLRNLKPARYGYKPYSKAFGAFRMYHSARMLEKPPFVTLDEIPQDIKIVYFPLQFEPEVSIKGQAPECPDQFSVLSQIALSLPADAVLVVKEHPFQGSRRPYHIYRSILQMPNAVMVRTSESSQAIIERAALICAITSTVAHEGAILGKPVAFQPAWADPGDSRMLNISARMTISRGSGRCCRKPIAKRKKRDGKTARVTFPHLIDTAWT